MRTFSLSVIVGVAFGASLSAQDPKAQPPKTSERPALSEKNQKYLDAYLDVWEKRMKAIESLETKIVLTETEAGPPVVKTTYTGDASILKPNFAKLFLKDSANVGNARKWRHFVADGEYLWDYDYSKKIARVLQLPKDGVGDNTIMAFLFGMKAAEIKTRYDLSIDVDDKDKHNDFYVHIQILPKARADMQEFKKAELVLWKNNKDAKYADLWMLPARLWFQHPNGNQITWEFKEMKTQTKLMKLDFKAPGFPDKEWKSEWVKPPTPTVSRVGAPTK